MTATYTVDFFAQIPGKGEKPLVTMTVQAASALDAQDKACKEADKKNITHPYVIARKASNTTNGSRGA